MKFPDLYVNIYWVVFQRAVSLAVDSDRWTSATPWKKLLNVKMEKSACTSFRSRKIFSLTSTWSLNVVKGQKGKKGFQTSSKNSRETKLWLYGGEGSWKFERAFKVTKIHKSGTILSIVYQDYLVFITYVLSAIDRMRTWIRNGSWSSTRFIWIIWERLSVNATHVLQNF